MSSDEICITDAEHKSRSRGMGDLKINIRQKIDKFEQKMNQNLTCKNTEENEHAVDLFARKIIAKEKNLSALPVFKSKKINETKKGTREFTDDKDDGTIKSEPKSKATDVFPKNMEKLFIPSAIADETIDYETQIIEYEQLLRRAQLIKQREKRKQALARAFELKLIDIENECKIELMNIRHYLQMLEPLKIAVEKWTFKTNDEHPSKQFDCHATNSELMDNSSSIVPALNLHKMSSNSNTLVWE